MENKQPQQGPFRLLDLPGEIRNRIYAQVLCSVAPAPSQLDITPLARISRQEPEPNGVCQVEHAIETAILRTCKAVHREAYDVMVKTNRFVRLRMVGYAPSGFLVESQVPILTMDREHAAQFQGYVLRIELVEKVLTDDEDVEEPGPRFDIMLLGRDWPRLCSALGKKSISFVYPQIHLTVNPWPTNLPDYKASITDFFSVKTQGALLAPFRTHLREFSDVEITGLVAPELADAVVKDVKLGFWPSYAEGLAAVKETDQSAEQLFTQGKIIEASAKWHDNYLTIQRISRSLEHSAEGGYEMLEPTINVSVGLQKCYIHQLRAVPASGLEIPFIEKLARGARDYFARALLHCKIPTPLDIPGFPAATEARLLIQHSIFLRVLARVTNEEIAQEIKARISPSDDTSLSVDCEGVLEVAERLLADCEEGLAAEIQAEIDAEWEKVGEWRRIDEPVHGAHGVDDSGV